MRVRAAPRAGRAQAARAGRADRTAGGASTHALTQVLGTLHYLLSFHAINFIRIMITALKLLFCIHVNILSNIVTTSV